MICNINKISDDDFKQVKDIFFESSTRKNFKSEVEKNDFLYIYLNYYKEYYSEYFLVVKDDDDDKIIGYICGSPNSNNDKLLFEKLSHYRVFEDLYIQYPAHLHINLHPSTTGKGIGSILLAEFESLFTGQNIGIHLLTSPKAMNRTFYLKNSYKNEYVRLHNEHELLFMGKLITD